MGGNKRIEVHLWAKETFVIRSPVTRPNIWCADCTDPSLMLRPDEAAALCATSARAVYRLIENGALHFLETGDGFVLVCLNSLNGSLCPK